MANAYKRIQGITIEISGDTSKLTKALHDVDTQLGKTKGNLKDIDNLLKFNPGNTELLTQKQQNLESAIKKTSDRLNELREASFQAMSLEEYDALQREIVDTETQLKNLKKEYNDFGSVAKQKIKDVGEHMKTLGDKIANVGDKFTRYVTPPLVALGVAGVKSFADVDKTMTLANQTMGNTAEGAEMLNQAMEEAAANSVYGMTDAANAVLNYAHAGLDAYEATGALAPAMNLAAGEGGNLETVSAGLVGTINAFHGSFNDAAKYADVFAAACNNSMLEIDALSSAMSVAAPTFNAEGYAVNDAALYLGVMADANIDASVAANSLKTGFARLVAPMKQGAEKMKQLGIEVTNADGSMKDSVTIQRELHEAFKDLSESEQIAAASAIFGKNQMAPWLALINTAPEDVADLALHINSAGFDLNNFAQQLTDSGLSIDDMREKMLALGVDSEAFDMALMESNGSALDFVENLWEFSNAGATVDDIVTALGGDMNTLQNAMDSTKGTADAMAEVMMSGFGGSIERLKSSFDVLVKNIGEALAPHLQKVIDFLQELVDKFNALTPAQQENIVKIGALVAAIGPVLSIGGRLLTGIGTILPLLIGPAGIVVAVGAVAAAIALNWDKITQWAAEAKEKIGKWIEERKTDISGFFTNIGEWFDGLGDSIRAGWGKYFQPVVDWIGEKFGGAVESIQTALRGVITFLKDVFSGNWEKAWNGIVDGFGNIFKKVGTLMKAPVNAVIDGVNWMIDKIEGAINSVVDAINRNLRIDVDFGRLPDFLGGGSLGGIHWGANLSRVSWGRVARLMANGGILEEGQRAIVGEYQPEYLRVVNGRAVVTPMTNQPARFGGDQTFNFTINTQPGQSAEQIAAAVKRVFVREMQERSAAYA